LRIKIKAKVKAKVEAGAEAEVKNRQLGEEQITCE
jgi:hypothetical protein